MGAIDADGADIRGGSEEQRAIAGAEQNGCPAVSIWTDARRMKRRSMVNARESLNSPRPPEKPPNRRPETPDEERDGDDDEAPETPPTEPEPVPIEEPPDAPLKRGPYVVDRVSDELR